MTTITALLAAVKARRKDQQYIYKQLANLTDPTLLSRIK